MVQAISPPASARPNITSRRRPQTAGCPFLAAALKAPVSELLASGRSLELDPALSPAELANRAPDLVNFAADVVESLRGTLHLFPISCAQVLPVSVSRLCRSLMPPYIPSPPPASHTTWPHRQVLYGVQQAVAKRYGELGYTVAGTLLWRRYLLEGLLAPAALGISLPPAPGPDQPGALSAFKRSVALAHRVLCRACDADGAFAAAGGGRGEDDAEELRLAMLNPHLPVLRARMDALLHDVLSLGSPATAVEPRAGAFDVRMLPGDLEVVRGFLRVRRIPPGPAQPGSARGRGGGEGGSN
jgi:hypothetical protein